MDVTLSKDKKTKQPVWFITFSEQEITERMIDILDMRIARAEIALKVCKHSKRRASLEKMHDAFVQFRNEQVTKLATMGGTSG